MASAGAGAIQSLTGNDYLQLFVTQIKNQDPTQPMDPSQMMASLAQMTTVQNLSQLGQEFQQSLATEMIGTQVTYTSTTNSQSTSATGVVQSAATQNGTVGVFVGGQFVPVSSVTQIAPASTSNGSTGS